MTLTALQTWPGYSALLGRGNSSLCWGVVSSRSPVKILDRKSAQNSAQKSALLAAWKLAVCGGGAAVEAGAATDGAGTTQEESQSPHHIQ